MANPFVDLEQIPTVGDISRYHAKERPHAIAQSFEERDTTFAELDRHTSQVANALISDGVKKGDRVAYVGKNSDHYFELFFGAAKMGAVMAPIGWRLAVPEIGYIIENSKAPMVFAGPEILDQALQAVEAIAVKPKVIAMEANDRSLPTFEAWRDAASDRDPMIALNENDVAVQLYTSGTTGRPKGAMLTNGNLLGGRRIAAKVAMDWNDWTPEDVSLVAMPVAHIGGTGWGMLAPVNGAKNVIAREFDPFKVLDYIEKDRISKLFMVPAALHIVIKQPRAREVDYSRLKYILYGASPIALELLRECIDVFGCGFCQQYGMTETTGTIVYLPPEDHDPAGNARMRGAGKALPGVELRIVDADGKTLPPNTTGQVATRSASNMAGYWGMDSATAETIDSEGWLLTGDAGYLDDDGYLYLQDRIKDVIISGGENIYPTEVENAIFGHPHVGDVAVIGVPDAQWGEAVKAIVVAKPGVTPDAASIIAHARERIAAYKAPKSVDFIDVLPRNASGKVLRRQLREPFWQGRTRGVN
ncbi:MAG: fatty acid--CoA ligase [Terricaulis sp.]